MKTSKDPRHTKRIQLMQDLFAWDFRKTKKPKSISEIVENIPKIDKLITDSAKDRPLDQINKIDLAILRLAIFELIIKGIAPPKVIIDEAVELGKEFGSDTSSSFVNGALGKLVIDKQIKIIE